MGRTSYREFISLIRTADLDDFLLDEPEASLNDVLEKKLISEDLDQQRLSLSPPGSRGYVKLLQKYRSRNILNTAPTVRRSIAALVSWNDPRPHVPRPELCHSPSLEQLISSYENDIFPVKDEESWQLAIDAPPWLKEILPVEFSTQEFLSKTQCTPLELESLARGYKAFTANYPSALLGPTKDDSSESPPVLWMDQNNRALDRANRRKLEKTSNILIDSFSYWAHNSQFSLPLSKLAKRIYNLIGEQHVPLNQISQLIELEVTPLMETSEHFLSWALHNIETKARHQELRIQQLPRPKEKVLPTMLTTVSALVEGEHLWLTHLAGSPGTQLIGRYATFNSDLQQKLRDQLLLDGHRKDVIYAEIDITLPGKALEVSARPLLTQHYIPLVSGRCFHEDSRKISPEELVIFVKDKTRVVLYCPRLGKEVIPIDSSPRHYRYVQHRPLLQFLRFLVFQDSWYNIDLASLGLSRLPHVPRLTLEGVIIYPETWSFDRNFSSLKPSEFLSEIPLQWVVLDDLSGRPLLVNLHSSAEREEAAKKLEQETLKGPVLIQEFLKAASSIQKQNRIFSVLSHTTPKPEGTNRLPARAREVSQKDCYFIKMYGPKEVLTDFLANELREICLTPEVEKFFYLFYRDDLGLHLRLRFFNVSGKGSFPPEKLQHSLEDFARDKGISFVTTLYRPEDELYGGEHGVRIFETFSALDSSLALTSWADGDYEKRVFLLLQLILSYADLLEPEFDLKLFPSDAPVTEETRTVTENILNGTSPGKLRDLPQRVLTSRLLLSYISSGKVHVSKNHFFLRMVHLAHNRLHPDRLRAHETYLIRRTLKHWRSRRSP